MKFADHRTLLFAVAAFVCSSSPLALLPAHSETPLSSGSGTKKVSSGGSVYSEKDKYKSREGERDRWSAKIRANPRDPSNYVGRAKDYMLLCEDEKALADFAKALELDPMNRDALYSRILLFGDIGRKEDALRDCNSLIKAYPKNTVGYERRCIIYQSMQKLKEALADTDSALKINPNSVTAWQYRCSIFINQGDSANALKCLNRLTELCPDNPTHFSVRANYYVKSKEYSKAIYDLSQTIKLRPNEFEPFIMRADVFKEMKDYKKAIADYSRAIEMNKFRAGHAYKGRGECYLAIGDKVAAARDFELSKSGEKAYR